MRETVTDKEKSDFFIFIFAKQRFLRETVTEKEISFIIRAISGRNRYKEEKSNYSISFIILPLLTGLQQHEIILGDFSIAGRAYFWYNCMCLTPETLCTKKTEIG